MASVVTVLATKGGVDKTATVVNPRGAPVGDVARPPRRRGPTARGRRHGLDRRITGLAVRPSRDPRSGGIAPTQTRDRVRPDPDRHSPIRRSGIDRCRRRERSGHLPGRTVADRTLGGRSVRANRAAARRTSSALDPNRWTVPAGSHRRRNLVGRAGDPPLRHPNQSAQGPRHCAGRPCRDASRERRAGRNRGERLPEPRRGDGLAPRTPTRNKRQAMKVGLTDVLRRGLEPPTPPPRPLQEQTGGVPQHARRKTTKDAALWAGQFQSSTHFWIGSPPSAPSVRRS